MGQRCPNHYRKGFSYLRGNRKDLGIDRISLSDFLIELLISEKQVSRLHKSHERHAFWFARMAGPEGLISRPWLRCHKWPLFHSGRCPHLCKCFLFLGGWIQAGGPANPLFQGKNFGMGLAYSLVELRYGKCGSGLMFLSAILRTSRTPSKSVPGSRVSTTWSRYDKDRFLCALFAGRNRSVWAIWQQRGSIEQPAGHL